MTERRGFIKSLFGGAAGFPVVKSIETLKLEGDDVLVLSVPGFISQEQTELLKHGIESRLPGRKCLVITGGMELKVLKSA